MTTITQVKNLPLPAHYDPANVVNDTRWIDYTGLERAAVDYRRLHNLSAVVTDRQKIGLLVIDAQNTFCHPKGELYVAGASGTGAVDDSIRTVEFIYRNLGLLTGIHCTLDTHRAYAVFHPSFLVDANGEHPAPFTIVTHDDVIKGVYKVDSFAASATGNNLMALQRQLEDYTRQLQDTNRYALTIWPYHAMLGDKGHALVSGLIEAVTFHALARGAQPDFEVKGTNPLTENYSVFGPEVKKLVDGSVVQRNTQIIEQLMKYDKLYITGQAKSHCVAWSIDDFLTDINAVDPALAEKVYLIEDCTTAIVIKDPATGDVIHDYGPDADKAFDKFRSAGMHIVKSTDPIEV